MAKILLVDDDLELQPIISKTLNDHQIVYATTCGQAKTIIDNDAAIDLVLLDIGLPDMNGLNFYMELQGNSKIKKIPFIFLSAKDQTSDKIAGLSLGAEDYITKPFDRLELRARVELRIKKSKTQQSLDESIELDDLTLNIAKQKLLYGPHHLQKELSLTGHEFKILVYLAKNLDRVISRHSILDSIWGNVSVNDRTVDTHLSNLRKKIGPTDYTIQSVYGEGYKFTRVLCSEKRTAA